MTAAEYAQAILEQDAKLKVLHEERGKAWYEMTDAIAQHRFLQSACDSAEDRRSELTSLMRQAAVNETMRKAAAPSDDGETR